VRPILSVVLCANLAACTLVGAGLGGGGGYLVTNAAAGEEGGPAEGALVVAGVLLGAALGGWLGYEIDKSWLGGIIPNKR
jgi:hypothetical protein